MKKLSLILSLLFFISGFSQQNIDKTIAVVGKQIVLRSDLEKQILKAKSEGIEDSDSLRAAIFEELLFGRLLIAQAEKDSIQIKDEQVDNELDRRMNYYLHQFGSEENFEAFYGKTVKAYKEELRDDIKEQLMAQQMQSKIIGGITVSPADVRFFYNSIPEDSLPLINSEVEIAHILKQPVVSAEAKKAAWEKIEGYRQRVIKGESMSVLATLYTEDPGSAGKGGKYEGISRGSFVPEFEAVAFRLRPGEISEVFETSFGYHFIELLSRRGEMVDVRHLLVTPKITNEDMIKAKLELDTIYEKIQSKKISFCEAAIKYSDDKDTRNNCGTLVNNQTGNTRFEVDELGAVDKNLVFMMDKMAVGEISKPLNYSTPDNKQAFRILYLKARTEPHKANLKDDYQRIQNMALMEKQKRIADEWVNKKIRSMYIKIDPEFKKYNFQHNWLKYAN